MLAELIPKVAAQEGAEKDQDKYQNYYARPSLAGPGRCLRQMVYWALGKEQAETNDRMYLVFDSANWYEELIADWIRKTSIRLHSEQMEVEVFGKHIPKGKGHIDGILSDLRGDERLWENKAINHFTWYSYWENEPPWDHICQTCIYLNGLQRVQPEITEAILFLVNRNTNQFIEYLIEYHDDCALLKSVTHSTGEVRELNILIPHIVGYCEWKFHLVQSFYDRSIQTGKDQLPERGYSMDDWHCSYCPYNEICWENFKEELENLRSDVDLPDELEDMIRYFQEVKMHVRSGEKERDELRDKIKALLVANDARSGQVGPYVVSMTYLESKSIDRDRIPRDLLDQLIVIKKSARLNVRKPEPKKRVAKKKVAKKMKEKKKNAKANPV